MTFYGGRDLAEAFRTVRKNTVQIAKDIPEDKYAYRPTPDSRSVAEELSHLAVMTIFHHEAHGVDKVTSVRMEDFGRYMARMGEVEAQLTTKAQIIDALENNGDAFARFLESLSSEQLGERVTFEPPIQSPQKTRFEMLLSCKEHEMHHRAKLMVMQRLIGMVPHLTREREQRMAAMATAKA